MSDPGKDTFWSQMIRHLSADPKTRPKYAAVSRELHFSSILGVESHLRLCLRKHSVSSLHRRRKSWRNTQSI